MLPQTSPALESPVASVLGTNFGRVHFPRTSYCKIDPAPRPSFHVTWHQRARLAPSRLPDMRCVRSHEIAEIVYRKLDFWANPKPGNVQPYSMLVEEVLRTLTAW
jgi:hypothetical protein